MNDISIGARPTLSSNDVAILRLKESIDELTREVRALNRVVMGNGDPSESLIAKVDCLLGGWDVIESWKLSQSEKLQRAWYMSIGNACVGVVNFLILAWLLTH